VGLAFNVKWFGAKGDGVTTDKAAIQAAIDACAADGGGTVYLPPGKYVCDDPTTGTGLQVTLQIIPARNG
jgi:polygalacturonase